MGRERGSRVHDEYGLTFIELVIVLAIIGILAVMAIPRIGIFGRQTAYVTTRQMIADLRYARSLAITSAKDHLVKFYSVYPTMASPYTEYRIFRHEVGGDVQVGELKNIPNEVTCSSVGGFSGSITFHPLGDSTCNGTIISVVQGSTQYTVTVIASTGRVY